eukprot:m.140353 g.140353  ORF g.140353 m.140353 type:complete len:55 (-) comp13180_c1_seq4:59-223(-)
MYVCVCMCDIYFLCPFVTLLLLQLTVVNYSVLSTTGVCLFYIYIYISFNPFSSL